MLLKIAITLAILGTGILPAYKLQHYVCLSCRQPLSQTLRGKSMLYTGLLLLWSFGAGYAWTHILGLYFSIFTVFLAIGLFMTILGPILAVVMVRMPESVLHTQNEFREYPYSVGIIIVNLYLAGVAVILASLVLAYQFSTSNI